MQTIGVKIYWTQMEYKQINLIKYNSTINESPNLYVEMKYVK